MKKLIKKPLTLTRVTIRNLSAATGASVVRSRYFCGTDSCPTDSCQTCGDACGTTICDPSLLIICQ